MKVLGAVLTFAFLAATAAPVEAFPVTAPPGLSPDLVKVANGCGQGRYRGPGGACHRFGHGPYPGGYFAGSHRGEGCGPGWYRGPGGACHRLGTGPYPNGYWAPH